MSSMAGTALGTTNDLTDALHAPVGPVERGLMRERLDIESVLSEALGIRTPHLSPLALASLAAQRIADAREAHATGHREGLREGLTVARELLARNDGRALAELDELLEAAPESARSGDAQAGSCGLSSGCVEAS